MTSSGERCGEKKGTLGYGSLVDRIAGLLESARRTSARAVNAVMTATYWEIGRRIVEFEQGGRKRAEYGEELLGRLSADLTARVGRGFSIDNLELMRRFYLAWPIAQTLSAQSGEPGAQLRISATVSRKSTTAELATSNMILPDAVWGISHHSEGLPSPLVSLCPLAFRAERACPRLL